MMKLAIGQMLTRSPEGRRAVIAAVRRVAFAGIILLGVWLVLVGSRAAIPLSVIESLAESTHMSVDAWSEIVYESDWSNSFWTNEPVAEMIGERLGVTAQLLGLGGLLSLAIAAVLLFLGVLISRVTERPGWLARARQVLRLVLVSGGVSTPIFVGTLFFVFSVLWWGWLTPTTYEGVSWWPVFFVSLLPAWLLVQAGHGELANWSRGSTSSYGLLARHLSVRLVTRLLKLVGAIIVINMLVGPGLGSLLIQGLNTRDFPVTFGVAWVFVLIVVLVKLVAELIEIAYNHFGRPLVSSEHTEEQVAPWGTIPMGWLFFSLALVLISIVVAVVGPVFAPYGYNEISLADRLAPPSAEHILGADPLGRDVFSRLLVGIRTTLWAGLLSTGVLSVVATGWAILAAYLRKAHNWLGDTLEDVVMLPRDVICAFPWLVLPLLWMSVGVGPSLWHVASIISLVLLPRAVGMMQEAYRAPPLERGWLYSVLWSIPVMFLLTVAGGILYTSTLSYFGFGIPPPTPELGGMLSEGRRYMLQAPWIAQWPPICLALLSLVWVMAGDALLERLGFRSKSVWAKTVE